MFCGKKCFHIQHKSFRSHKRDIYGNLENRDSHFIFSAAYQSLYRLDQPCLKWIWRRYDCRNGSRYKNNLNGNISDFWLSKRFSAYCRFQIRGQKFQKITPIYYDFHSVVHCFLHIRRAVDDHIPCKD